jgi:hypothetical protein
MIGIRYETEIKTFDAPLIDVIDDANIPPVQDSAKEIFNFFFD